MRVARDELLKWGAPAQQNQHTLVTAARFPNHLAHKRGTGKDDCDSDCNQCEWKIHIYLHRETVRLSNEAHSRAEYGARKQSAFAAIDETYVVRQTVTRCGSISLVSSH